MCVYIYIYHIINTYLYVHRFTHMKDLTLINTIGNQRVRDSDPDVFKIKGSVTYRFFQGLAIWTLKGGWVNLCDATKVNSKYRFFKK